MRVIGTAGHVDHGKSTLVAALTGTHPDRLKEEKDREMTIDLGFGWMDLPSGETVGIIDVPGHRDFIENMLAGIGGIDAALFVIAADEGVMPQTREHLAILDLLQIQSGVIALTKIDLVDGDPDWIAMVMQDIHQVLSGTVLEKAPVIAVSSRSGAGLSLLRTEIERCLSGRPDRPDLGRPRLPVDRVFTMAGFGTVVTGTLMDGRFKVGDEIQIYPSDIRGRIRGLQTHRKKEDIAVPGSRTAINISGVDASEFGRGFVIAHPGVYQPTKLVDVSFRLLHDVSHSLRHNSIVKLFAGSAEVQARVRLLGVDELSSGMTGWLQLELTDPMVLVRGDRYILRRPSPGETIGGGVVVDAHPGRRHKRFDLQILSRLEALQQGSDGDILEQALIACGIAPMREVSAKSGLSIPRVQNGLEELSIAGGLEQLEEGKLDPSSDFLVCTHAYWVREKQRTLDELSGYHKAYPLRRGIPKEEFKSRLKISTRVFNSVLKRLEREGLVEVSGIYILNKGHSINLNTAQKELANNLLERFARSPFESPSVKDCQAALGVDLYQALIDLEELVQVSSEVVFRKQDYDRMVDMALNYIKNHDTLSVAEFRDILKSSRKYVLGFLEHLDANGITIRDGDVRRLRKKIGG